MPLYVVRYNSNHAINIRERSPNQIRERYDTLLAIAKKGDRIEVWHVSNMGDIKSFTVDGNEDLMAFNAWLRG